MAWRRGDALHKQVGTPHDMLTSDQQHELLRITKSACAIIDLSKDIIVVMGLNVATAERISLGVLESYHHVRSFLEATGRPGSLMNWGELCRFADRKSLEIIHFPEYCAGWPSRPLVGELREPDTPLLPGRHAPEPARPAFVLPPGVTAYFPHRSLPPTPPAPWSLSSCYPPTDARYRPRESGYWHWVDDADEVHVIYGPDIPLPLPPSYQHVHTMSAAEADLIAAASEAERRAATFAGAPCALEGCSLPGYHDLLTGTSERCCSHAHEQAVSAEEVDHTGSKVPATPIIAVEGNIGTGKSTLLQLLKERYADDPSVVFVNERVAD